MDNCFQPVYVEIIKVMGKMQERGETRIFPHDVAGWVAFGASLYTIRRYMRRMAEAGLLQRKSYKGGYQVAAETVAIFELWERIQVKSPLPN